MIGVWERVQELWGQVSPVLMMSESRPPSTQGKGIKKKLHWAPWLSTMFRPQRERKTLLRFLFLFLYRLPSSSLFLCLLGSSYDSTTSNGAHVIYSPLGRGKRKKEKRKLSAQCLLPPSRGLFSVVQCVQDLKKQNTAPISTRKHTHTHTETTSFFSGLFFPPAHLTLRAELSWGKK